MTDLNNITVKLTETSFNVKVNKVDGNIQSTDPITVKNQIQEIHSIDDLGLNLTNRTDGATLIWNAANNQYDVKPVFITNTTTGSVSANNALFLNNKPDTFFAANSALQNYYLNTNPYGFVNSSFGVAGSANNSQFLRGKTEDQLNVNNAITSNSALYLSGKSEGTLNVNNAIYANSSLYLGGKTETNLNVNNAIYANNSSYLGGKVEGSLNVNNAIYANSATYLNGKLEAELDVDTATYATLSALAITANTATYFNGIIDCGVY